MSSTVNRNVCVLSRFHHIWLCVTPWIVAHQAPLSMESSKSRILELPCPPPGDLPDPGVRSVASPVSSASQVDSLPLSHPRSSNRNAERTKMGAQGQNCSEFEDKIHTLTCWLPPSNGSSSSSIQHLLNLHLGMHMALRKMKLLPVQGPDPISASHLQPH